MKARNFIVAEGYVDVIAMTSAGFEATVAPLGTALTSAQCELLWKMSEEPILCFDGDQGRPQGGLPGDRHGIAFDRARPVFRALRFCPKARTQTISSARAAGRRFCKLLSQALPLAELIWIAGNRRKNLYDARTQAGLEQRLSRIARAIQG